MKKKSPEAIIAGFDERRQEARVRRVKAIVLTLGSLAFVATFTFSLFYFFYDSAFFPIFVGLSTLLPVWIGYRWVRWSPPMSSKKEA